MDRFALDKLLESWARWNLEYYLSTLSHSKVSPTYKVIEQLRTGIMSATPGKVYDPDIPVHLHIINEKINELSTLHKLVLKKEYEGTERKQKQKAMNLGISYSTYKNKLGEARRYLMS